MTKKNLKKNKKPENISNADFKQKLFIGDEIEYGSEFKDSISIDIPKGSIEKIAKKLK